MRTSDTHLVVIDVVCFDFGKLRPASVNECVSLEEHSDTPFTPTNENQHYFKPDSALQQFRAAVYYS